MIDIELVTRLYRKYKGDLIGVKKMQADTIKRIQNLGAVTIQDDYGGDFKLESIGNAQLCDIEAEILYLLIREFKPETIVEISPYCGWSTSWILHALKANDSGMLYSFDKISESTKTVQRELKTRWRFVQGDVKEQMEAIPKKIDFLFMDSDHSADFTKWYIKELFPLVDVMGGGLIAVHDMIRVRKVLDTKHFKDGEDNVLFDFMKANKIAYFTAALYVPSDWGPVNEEINKLRKELGITNIQEHNTNSMIFFKRMEELK